LTVIFLRFWEEERGFRFVYVDRKGEKERNERKRKSGPFLKKRK
jgi:hypothetical protein